LGRVFVALLLLVAVLSKGACLAASAPADGAEASLLADLAAVCSVTGSDQSGPAIDHHHGSGECDGCEHMQPSITVLSGPVKVDLVVFTLAADFLVPASDRPASVVRHLRANGSRAPPLA
jgi:hypothetical protein